MTARTFKMAHPDKCPPQDEDRMTLLNIMAHDSCKGNILATSALRKEGGNGEEISS